MALRRILAISAVALAFAGAAPGVASAHLFHTEVSPAFLEVRQLNKPAFEFSGGIITCNELSFEVEVSNLQSQIAVHPNYKSCSIFGLVVQVFPNNCVYVLKGATAKGGHGGFELACEPGKAFELGLPAASCVARFPSQIAGQGVVYQNEGKGAQRDFKVTMTPSSLVYETIGMCTLGNGKDGTLTGALTAKGLTVPGGAQVGVWVE